MAQDILIAVTLEVHDARGRLVRRFSSADSVPKDSGLNIPDYWIRPPQVLSREPGMHRFVWDLHYPPPAALSHSYPISAVYRDTWREPRGPVALPGRYTVRIRVAGRSLTQPLTIRMDPRVKTPAAGLAQQFALATRLSAAMNRDYDAVQALRAMRVRMTTLPDSVAARLDSLTRLNGALAGLLDLIDGVDAAPSTQAVPAVATLEARLARLVAPRRRSQSRPGTRR